MANIVGYFGVAAVVIALAFIIKTARKKEEKKSKGLDRMNFVVRTPKTIRIVGIVCTAVFGTVLVLLLAPAGSESNFVVTLLALAFVVIAACILYYSYRWKLVVAEETLVLRPLFGKELKYSISDVARIETKSVYFIRVFGESKKLFSAPGLSQGGVMLVSYFIEKGVEAPAKITELDSHWY